MTTTRLQLAQAITAIELPLVLAISPVLLFPSPARLLVLIAVPVVWASARIATGHVIPPTPLNMALLLMLGMVGVSLVVTIDVIQSLPKVAGMILGALLFWAIVRWTTTAERLQLLTAAFLLAGTGLAMVALLGANWDNKFAAVGAITSKLPTAIRGVPGAEIGFNTNATAACLLLFIPVQVALVVSGWRWRFPGATARWSRSGWFVAAQVLLLLLTAGTLVLTESRTAWVGLLAGTACFFLWHGRWTRGLLATGIASLLAAAAAFGPNAVYEAVVSRAGPAFISTFDLRMKLWVNGLQGIQDLPLTGFGMNVFRKVVLTRYTGYPALPGEEPAHVHNHLLQAALDLGIPGLVGYLALWLLAAVLLVEVYRRSGVVTYRAIAGGLGVGLIAHFVFGFADVIPLGAKVGVLFWLTLGLTAALHRIAVSPSRSVNPA